MPYNNNYRKPPVFSQCAGCPETRWPALGLVRGVPLCANCRSERAGNVRRHRGWCAGCWRDGLPLQEHHPGRALWHPDIRYPVCLSCHLMLSALQRSPVRWDDYQSLQHLQAHFGADHGWRELALGTMEMAALWAQSRPIFAPDWELQPGDEHVLVPLAPRRAISRSMENR